MDLTQLKKEIDDCEILLIGIGTEWNLVGIEEFDKLAEFLGKKNFFIVSSIENKNLRKSQINQKRVTAPFCDDEEEGKKQWDFYNKWLSTTLNHNLLILELGEDFLKPNFMRWPFENVTFINKKSKMVRINNNIPNLPDNISDRGYAIKDNSVSIILKLMEM